MADLFDYMDWRGDLDFGSSPANEADYYIISKIGCPNLTDIVPADAQETPICAVVEAYRAGAGGDGVSREVATSQRVLDSFFRLLLFELLFALNVLTHLSHSFPQIYS